MKIFRKLVRDNVPEIMIKDGSKPTTRVLAEPEYLKALDDKLLEEVQELRHGDEDRKEEMADIYEVLDAMAKVHGFSKEDILRIQEEKRTRRGGFEKRIFLESAE
ncbi:MAG: nucleoside triphosphate pyrophosphohydrolase [Patescibacteria group bacterium]